MKQVLYELPEGWEWFSVKDLSSKVQYGYTTKAREKGNAQFLRITDIQNGQIKWSDVPLVSVSDKELEKYCLHEDDLVFARSGATSGKSILIVNPPRNSIFASYLIRVVPDTKIVFPKFLELFFQSPDYWKQVGENVSGAAQPNINGTKLSGFQVSLPPLNEQKRIVAKLDVLFIRIGTAITHLQQTIEHSKALFASALDGEFSSLSDRVKISDIADVKGGKRLPKGNKLQDNPSSHPYIRVADFTDAGSIDMNGLKYISDEIYEQIKRYTITSRDLYISIAGTIGKTGIVFKELNGANLTENAAKLVFKVPNNIDVRYIYYFTLSHDFSEQAGLATKTVAQPKLALTRLSKIQLPVPDIEVQQRIVDKLDTLADQTRTLEAVTQEKISDLTTLKASLLDAAFKGQL